MAKFLLTFIVFLTLSVQAQTFDELMLKGDTMYQNKQYLASAEAYDAAFEIEAGDSLLYYNTACSWALAGYPDKAIKYLQLSADAGWYNFDFLSSDQDLVSIRDSKVWEPISKQIGANLVEKEKDYNHSLKDQLEKIYTKDQTLRHLHNDASAKFGNGSDEMNYFWELIAMQDSLNEIEIVAILEKFGWAGESVVGERGNKTIWLAIQHAPLETQEKYLPLLQESVKNDESEGSHLALLEDRILMRNDKPQIYGSQITRDEKTGEFVVYKVKDPEKINARRDAIGLPPIQEYISHWGLEWTVEQK